MTKVWMRDVKHFADEIRARKERRVVWREIEAVAMILAWCAAAFLLGLWVGVS